MLEIMVLLKINFINDYTNKGLKMKTYKELKEFINDLELELNSFNNAYHIYPSNDFLSASVKEYENLLKYYERIKYKFECKFKYSIAWCCKYKKQYDFKKYLKHNENSLKPYHLNKELIHI